MPRRLRAIVVGCVLGIAGLAPCPAVAVARARTVSAHPWLHLADAFYVGSQAVTIPHRVVHLSGGEWPYLPGQWVTLRVTIGSRVLMTRQLPIRPASDHGYGQFRAAIVSPGVGMLAISITHSATPGLAAFSTVRRLQALDVHVGFGARGRFVALIQQRLAALHIYVPQTGVYDQGTGLALDAYHRLLRWGTYQHLDGPTISYLLAGIGVFRIRFASHGRHAEGNLALQLLALANGSHIHAIYPISSGKPSTPTILGDFHVYSKVPGYLPDGMYYSNFFVGGYAIHGYDPAPDYPASHGCMRLPIVDATSVYGWLAIGDWVDVYH